MFMIEIAGLKVLYTGDYSREEDRHLVIAEVPPVKPDVMICESTFGVHTLPDRKDKEEQFTSECWAHLDLHDRPSRMGVHCSNILSTRPSTHGHIVPCGLLQSIEPAQWNRAWKGEDEDREFGQQAVRSLTPALVSNIVKRGGRCLMPIPSFGNGQELALLLEEYWHDHPELQNVPIYFASGLFARGMRVYKTYVHTMNASIRARFARRDNPFDFKYVKWLREPRRLDDHKGPCVVMASAQFMSFGLSRELLENWAGDSKNGVIVTGYSIEGTMARVSAIRHLGGVADSRRSLASRITSNRSRVARSHGA